VIWTVSFAFADQCGMWHLHGRVLQHDGIRVSLAWYRFLWLDHNGRIYW
jgi:hypothetical protein